MKNFRRQSIAEFDDISSIDNYHRALAEGFSEQQALGFINQRSRDNSRMPFPWSDSANGGFNRGARPWLAFSAADFSVNAQSQINDSDSVFAFYQKMIALRNKHYPQTLIYGSFAAIEDVDDRIIAYERRTATERFISITNLSAQPLPFTLPAGEIVLNNYADAETPLKPYQTLLVKE